MLKNKKYDPSKCQRCGVREGADLVNVHMSCRYDMSEIGLPFHEHAVTGEPRRLVSEKKVIVFRGGPRVRLKKFANPLGNKYEFTREYYSLTVCKNCRARWMSAIKTWFEGKN